MNWRPIYIMAAVSVAYLAVAIAAITILTTRASGTHMALKFDSERAHTSATQIATVTWRANPTDHDAFNIVQMFRSDVLNMAAGRTNFFGYEKPKLGIIEEVTHVYMASWVYVDAHGKQHLKPLVGNYYGGFASYKEAEQMCNDVWSVKDRYRSSVLHN